MLACGCARVPKTRRRSHLCLGLLPAVGWQRDDQRLPSRPGGRSWEPVERVGRCLSGPVQETHFKCLGLLWSSRPEILIPDVHSKATQPRYAGAIFVGHSVNMSGGSLIIRNSTARKGGAAGFGISAQWEVLAVHVGLNALRTCTKVFGDELSIMKSKV